MAKRGGNFAVQENCCVVNFSSDARSVFRHIVHVGHHLRSIDWNSHGEMSGIVNLSGEWSLVSLHVTAVRNMSQICSSYAACVTLLHMFVRFSFQFLLFPFL